MTESEDRLRRLESEIERRLLERFAGLRDEFERLRLESDRRWEGFLSRFDQDFTGLVPPELVAIPEPPPPPESGDLPERPTGSGLLSIEAARNLDDAGNQVEALHRFLELCRGHASRAALLISKSGSFVVWKATGFGEHGGSDEAARRVVLPMDGGPLSQVIEGSSFRLAEGNDVSVRLGASNAFSAVLVPMVVKEKVSGAVYADCTADDEKRFDPESIAFLTFLAGLFVDRLAGRKLKPAPAMRKLEFFEVASPAEAPEAAAPVESAKTPAPAASQKREEAPPVAPAPAEEQPAESSRPGPRETFGTQMLRAAPPLARPEPVPPPAEPERSAPEPAEPERDQAGRSEAEAEAKSGPDGLGVGASASESAAPEPSLAYEPDDEPATPERTSSRGEIPDAPTPPTPPPPTSAEPVRPISPPSEPPASSAFQPPSGGRRLAGPLAPADGDERRDEARRFAKLLVSEIKLYNEKAVLEGRQHGDLYPRLREDIDRSRQMYDERIPEDVRSNSNFFYEELVRILAEGRAESLGL
ncbi:MAG: hypothetical protein ABI914_05340 [Acidobacteriota bacterium]